MRVLCLGQVTIGSAQYDDLIKELNKLGSGEEGKRLSTILPHFRLGEKRYVSMTDKGEVDRSQNILEITLKRSREKPQPIGEILETKYTYQNLSIKEPMLNRLWLYDSRLYQVDRNDLSQEQIHLLIFDFLEKQNRKFEDLERKYKERK